MRLDEVLRRLREAAPFQDGASARYSLESIMRQVEDELSGVPESEDASMRPADGRMYPPHDSFERSSGSPRVRLFRQRVIELTLEATARSR